MVRFLFRYRGLRILGHGVRRLASRDEWALIQDFDGDLKFHCHLGEHIGSQMYWRDSYSWDQLKVLDTFLGSESVFFDIGANQGEFTLFAAKRLTQGTVYAFEPTSEMFARLSRNVEENGFENVRLIQAGLWSESETKPIFTNRSRFSDGSRHEGLGTLFRTEERDSVVEVIRLTTLDSLARDEKLTRLDAMKLDVEGAEHEVIRGGLSTMERFRPVLLIEVSRLCLEAAGTSDAALLDLLSRWSRFELVRKDGRSTPIRADHLGAYQNILCLPK